LEFAVDPDHPALPGHFPGNPIVPGVMILDRVLAPVYRDYPDHAIELVQVKFSSPLMSGEICRIAFASDRSGGLRFECHHGNRLIASGLLRLEQTLES
jgi:3-hydroxyacyl-[acyl-carrier-protein] dehydratase